MDADAAAGIPAADLRRESIPVYDRAGARLPVRKQEDRVDVWVIERQPDGVIDVGRALAAERLNELIGLNNYYFFYKLV